jgi:hypothetical protein
MDGKRLNKLIVEFNAIGLNSAVNFELFNRLVIVYHSSAIKGNLYWKKQRFLFESITAKGQPMLEHQVVTYHYAVLLFLIECAKNI